MACHGAASAAIGIAVLRGRDLVLEQRRCPHVMAMDSVTLAYRS